MVIGALAAAAHDGAVVAVSLIDPADTHGAQADDQREQVAQHADHAVDGRGVRSDARVHARLGAEPAQELDGHAHDEAKGDDDDGKAVEAAVTAENPAHIGAEK